MNCILGVKSRRPADVMDAGFWFCQLRNDRAIYCVREDWEREYSRIGSTWDMSEIFMSLVLMRGSLGNENYKKDSTWFLSSVL